ncbi:hypothetical protein P3553_10430 [Vibrio parahaemolyticus]|uniref:hypothetical protein n=1 Tax=Vibrio parahaemolyticus TaxID=670 RepID=UPI001A8ED9BF|nr:hypothetical protein [Vibrio parahaemolyticus]MBO0167111.1 hypothetical protein [Vibrio parahaemolyticus]MDF4752515.1 hypothetical protein [Vibrio parahaemolyticus]MDF4778629.1 hypothetical protein [Vibrio parahaemolyticus]MDF4786600.1 hypothetical protein [Vibrio parahaemolyticus]MDF4794472.1 hypothetical protein [Vibrio parahaemolyticus]
MEDLNKKYELLYSQLEPVKQEKLKNIVDQWLPQYKQDLNTVLEDHLNLHLVQSPVLLIGGAGIAVSKMRFQTYLKNLKTDTIILLDVGLYSYKQKEEKERVPFILKWLERPLTPRKKKKEPKNLVERFELMLKSFDNGSDLKKSLDTLHELNMVLRPHLKNIMKGVRGAPTVYDWRYKCNISKEQIKTLINNLTE